MLIWMLGLAAAVSVDEVAAEMPQAREFLEACATDGCHRQEGARAAWLLALGTYLQTGKADGALAATVRVLDVELFDQLPDAVREGATAPFGWANRVGGPEGASTPGRRSVEGQLLQIRQFPNADAPRVFVLGPMGSDPPTPQEVVAMTGLWRARIYPGWEFCQQREFSVTASSRPTGSEYGTVSFRGGQEWDGPAFDATYETWVSGQLASPRDSQGLLRLTQGFQQVALLRPDGVGAVLDLPVEPSQTIDAVDHARECAANAAEGAPNGLIVHFKRIHRRLPEADLYVVRYHEDSSRKPTIYRWDGARMSLR